MSRTLIVVAVLAMFVACAFATAEVSVAVAESEVEDQSVLAAQQAAFEATLDADEIEESDQAEDESEEGEGEESEEESEEESDEESEDESEEETESEDESEEETEEESESEEEADEESEEEESEESETEYVLAELQDNAVTTGFMEMTAKFVPTESRTADHLVHSASSEVDAIAKQNYLSGHADGFAAASLVETEAEAETESETEAEGGPVYVSSNGAQYYGAYPTYAGVSVSPLAGGIPVPPQLPTWLPPPPYITPVADKGSKDE